MAQRNPGGTSNYEYDPQVGDRVVRYSVWGAIPPSHGVVTQDLGDGRFMVEWDKSPGYKPKKRDINFSAEYQHNLWPEGDELLPRAENPAGPTYAQALVMARHAGQKIGDTSGFQPWLVKSKLGSRGSLVKSHLKTEFWQGVEEGEGPAPTAHKVTLYKGVTISRTDEGYVTGVEPESTFESEREAKRFIDAQVKGKANPGRMRRVKPIPRYLMSSIRSAAEKWGQSLDHDPTLEEVENFALFYQAYPGARTLEEDLPQVKQTGRNRIAWDDLFELSDIAESARQKKLGIDAQMKSRPNPRFQWGVYNLVTKQWAVQDLPTKEAAEEWAFENLKGSFPWVVQRREDRAQSNPGVRTRTVHLIRRSA